MYWNHTNRNGTNKTTTTEFFFFLVSDFLIFGELFTHSHSFPLSDLNKYLMVTHFWWATWVINSKGMSKSLAVLWPFEDKTWKICWYSRNFYSLFLVVHWVYNFLNFLNYWHERPHIQQHCAQVLHPQCGLHHEGPGHCHEAFEEEEATNGQERVVVFTGTMP